MLPWVMARWVERGSTTLRLAVEERVDGSRSTYFKMNLSTTYLLVWVGERTSLDGKIIQVTFVSEKTKSDLEIYLHDLRTKLATTFREKLDGKRGINFCVAVYVHYTSNQRSQRDAADRAQQWEVDRHKSGGALPSTPIPHRCHSPEHVRFNRNLSGLVLTTSSRLVSRL